MRNFKGFTIVELLIVIVVIGILAALVIGGYSAAQKQAHDAKKESDLQLLYKAVIAARENTGKTLMQITGSGYSAGRCWGTNNPDGTEPRLLPKTHICWVRNENMLTDIAAAGLTNLDALKTGDPLGNPYLIDENEGEGSPTNCNKDSITHYTGNGASTALWRLVPNSLSVCI